MIRDSIKMFSMIVSYLPVQPLIVEAGAYDGKNTIQMATQWPHGTIHAFEPVPAMAERLVYNTRHISNIVVHPYALSERNGTELFYVMHKKRAPHQPSQTGSLLEPQDAMHPRMVRGQTIEVTTCTLDTWAADNQITHIDLLWLDTQGTELTILEHAPTMLSHTRVIHIEVNFVQRYANQPTSDEVMAFLTNHNFTFIGVDADKASGRLFGNALFVHNIFL